MGGGSALVCSFYYPLHLSSFAPMPFLLFLPCIILLCVSYVCTYPPWDEGHGLKGLHCFFILPRGLVHLLDGSSCPFNPLGFCPYCFSFYYAHGPTGCHFCHVGPLGFLPLFLGFHGPFTFFMLLSLPSSFIFLCCWAFSIVGPFVKNGYQHLAPWACGLLLQFICECPCCFLSRAF